MAIEKWINESHKEAFRFIVQQVADITHRDASLVPHATVKGCTIEIDELDPNAVEGIKGFMRAIAVNSKRSVFALEKPNGSMSTTLQISLEDGDAQRLLETIYDMGNNLKREWVREVAKSALDTQERAQLTHAIYLIFEPSPNQSLLRE